MYRTHRPEPMNHHFYKWSQQQVQPNRSVQCITKYIHLFYEQKKQQKRNTRINEWNFPYRLIIPDVLSALCRCSITDLSAFALSAIFIHGCRSTASALNRFGAFFTKRPRIKSFASLLTSDHSLSGKLYRPIWNWIKHYSRLESGYKMILIICNNTK